ncbi:MAG TPA: hypothetical protein VG755_12240, partial [Nannocystaceae bacterium]|nr:hypothetical protein [Nannocystaceae bacterium]
SHETGSPVLDEESSLPLESAGSVVELSLSAMLVLTVVLAVVVALVESVLPPFVLELDSDPSSLASPSALPSSGHPVASKPAVASKRRSRVVERSIGFIRSSPRTSSMVLKTIIKIDE